MAIHRLLAAAVASLLVGVTTAHPLMQGSGPPPVLAHNSDTVVALAHYTAALAVDSKTHRAFVLTDDPAGPYGSHPHLSVFNTLSGQRVRADQAIPGPVHQLVLDDDERRVIALSDATSATVIDAASGSVVHAAPVMTVNSVAQIVGGGTALDSTASRLFITDGLIGHVRVVSTQSGRLLQQLDCGQRGQRTASEVKAIDVDPSIQRVFILCAQDVNSGGAFEQTIRTVDARSGRLMGVVTISLQRNTADATTLTVDRRAHRVLVFQAATSTLLVLDAHNGARLSSMRIRASSIPPPGSAWLLTNTKNVGMLASAGQIVVADPVASRLSAIDYRRGLILWSSPIVFSPIGSLPKGSAPILFTTLSVVVDEARHRIWTVSQAGGLATYDAMDGRRLFFSNDTIGVHDATLDMTTGDMWAITGFKLVVLRYRAGGPPQKRSMSLGWMRVTLALDEAAKRVLAIGQGSLRQAPGSDIGLGNFLDLSTVTFPNS